MRKVNRKDKNRIFSLLLLFVFFISSSQALLFSGPVSASVEERDISVEWGDNVFQNLPYDYTGTFYENTDPTAAWDTAKIEFTYIPDPTINDEYPITQDFTNYESKFAHGEQNLTMTEGSYSNFDNIQSNDNNYASFNHTGVGHYNATYSFEDELDRTSGDNIEFVDTATISSSCSATIVGNKNDHKKILDLYDNNNAGNVRVSNSFSNQATGTVEVWIQSDDVSVADCFIYVDDDDTDFYRESLGIRIVSSNIQYYDGGLASWQTALGISDNVWYHTQIDFSEPSNTYDFYVNGILEASGIQFRDNPEQLNRITFATDNTESLYHYYIDAIDYSWDSDYIEGRNREDLDPLGHYPGTYSFGDYPVWTSGTDIEYVLSWSGVEPFIEDKEGHRKALYLNNSAGYSYVWHEFENIKSSGELEFWWYLNSSYSNWFQRFRFRNTTHSRIGALCNNMGSGGSLDWYNEDSTTNFASNLGTGWIHVNIEWNGNNVDISINGGQHTLSTNFKMGGIDVYRTAFHVDKAEMWVDAIGYSWDSNYNIGDNVHFNNYEAFPCHSFEQENTGDYGHSNIQWVQYADQNNENTIIINEFNAHKKCIKLTGAVAHSAYNYLSTTSCGIGQTNRPEGSIEGWIKSSDATNNCYITLYEDGTSRAMLLKIDADTFHYYEGDGIGGGSWTDSGTTTLDNIWYHFRIFFDCATDTYDVWVDNILLGNSLGFVNNGDYVNKFNIRKGTSVNHDLFFDSIGYSWDSNYNVGDNQHCNVEAVIDFTVDVPFEYYESFILQVNMDSRYYTNVHTNISWNFYNFTSSSWTEISNNHSITETLREFDDSDVSVGLTGLFDSNGNMKFRYYGYNCSAFYLEIDELTANMYFGTQFEYEKTLKLLGTWKYRFKLNLTLNNEHITDWIYFNVVEQPANFEGISESRYSTRWVLTSTATTGELTEVYYDDLTSGYWDLTDTLDKTVSISGTPDKDAYVAELNPDTNYGADTMSKTRYRGYDIEYWVYLEWDYSSELYLKGNYSDTSNLHCYVSYVSDPNRILTYHTTDFTEATITWNNKPALGLLSEDYSGPQVWGWRDIPIGTPNQWYGLRQYRVNDSSEHTLGWRSKEYTGSEPAITHYFYKNHHNTSGEGSAYFQTNTTETLGLISPKLSSNTSLIEGDVFTVDLQSTSDNALLKLYSGGVLQQTINLLTANTETSRQEVEVIVSEDVCYDEVKIISELSDTEYFKLYDIKAEHWVFESEEDQKIMYVEPYGQNELILNLGNNSLKIYENDILRTDTYITMTYDLTTHIFESPIPETVFVSFYDTNNDYLDFNQFTTYINYTLFEENFVNQRLTSREFYVDEDSTIYFNVYDSFDVNIYSASRLAKTFIDITLNVYTLKIKNEALDDASYTLTKGSVSKTGILFPDEIDEYKIASGSYTFAYIKGTDPEESIDFTLSGDKLLKINRSQMCFLSYTNQRGEYLNFNQFKTYWNGTLLYENVFYEDIGNNVSIEIKDHYDISVKNHSFIVSSGDNYIPVILTMYSLKVFNQQEVFNHINITRDPNYYESGYSWSEWVAPTEIIEFTLFPGYYKINLTDNENSGSSYYSYTLNGDDVLLISSGNTISNLIINIANVNTTIGNQITNVQIDLTNQNSNINNTIINIDINLSNVNSSLGTLLTNINLDIVNINNNISNLYTFTENNFLNLGNNINNSFISIENNIIAINQTISTLVIGLDGKITIVNATINTMFTEMNSQFIVTQSTLDFSFTFLNQTIVQIGNNITENHIALNNLIIQRANEIDNSLIQISTLVNLINSSVVNESLVIQSLVNIIGNNITENHVIINDLINLIGNNITENNINMVSLIELTGNNITTNQFVIQTLIDFVSNNITENHLEFLTNINLINNTIGQNQIELINRLLFINNSINTMALDLTNQILLVNNTIYSAILDVYTSIEFNSDNILGNISLTYQQNDFLTELYKETMFSQLLNWSDVAFNYSLMESRIDVWEFINNYKNQSIEVHLRYQGIIDNLTITAQNSIPQYLPKYDTDYNLWSVKDQKYLDTWEPLPDNRTVPFGFYEAEIPDIPDFNAPNTVLMIILILMGCGSAIALVGYMAYRYRKKSENYRRSYADKITFDSEAIKNFSQGTRIK